MKGEILYKDSLIIISDETIILKHYYLPFISKIISFHNIEKIETLEIRAPETVLYFPIFGWRVFGLGIIGRHITWFPFDLARSWRDLVFIISYKNQRIKSGFSVANSQLVAEILKEKEWLQNIFS